MTTLRIQTFNVGGPGLMGVTTKSQRCNGPFATMLAKIGYCYAVAEKGFDAFDGDPIRTLLRGARDDVYNFVGSSERGEHLTNRHLHGLYFRQRGEWLTVLVHLFASLGAEDHTAYPYEVVVGKLNAR